MHVDLLLKNAKIADLFRLRLFDGWLGIVDNRFVYVEEGDPPQHRHNVPFISGCHDGLLLVGRRE